MANDLKVQIAVSNSFKGLYMILAKKQGFSYNIYIFIHFLTTDVQLALAQRCACASSHIAESRWKGHARLVLLLRTTVKNTISFSPPTLKLSDIVVLPFCCKGHFTL